MSTVKQITIKELKYRIEQIPYEPKGNRNDARRIFSDQLKSDVVSYHYQSGRTLISLSQELNVSAQIISRWKKAKGKERTVVLHGKGTRNDVRTKCLAVKSFIKGKIASELSREYNVAEITIYAWVKQYKEKYEEYIDLPDGVTVIAKEDRHVYGNKNIQEVEQFLRESNEQLTSLIDSQHYTKTEINILRKMREKGNKEQEEVNTLKESAKKYNIKI